MRGYGENKRRMSNRKFIVLFIRLTAMILIIVAGAKLISATGSAEILKQNDPVLMISFRHVLLVAALVEGVVALICLSGKSISLQISLIAWLSTAFLLYHIGVFWIGYHKPCPCLGNIPDALHTSPRIADVGIIGVVTYMFVGSYGILLSQWLKKWKTEGSMKSGESAIVALRREEGGKAQSGGLKTEM